MRTSFDRGDLAIRCDRLGKRYRIGDRERYRALRDTISEVIRSPWERIRAKSRRQPSPLREFLWALQEVSFEGRRGEVLGIVGRNGAGKSTLLKILSRITQPTTGCAQIHGRLGALLEVGTGFHPELTGRENIFLNGAILGMKRREIDRKFDEIVDFSECEQFLDLPMKRYSSGMYMRLAFSVAAHLETEVLLVDEVLAVGDAAFQQKCLGKMDAVAHAGRTVLFVSHNTVAVNSLCTRAICLDRGRIAFDGVPAEVTARYLEECMPPVQDVCSAAPESAAGDHIFRLRRASARVDGHRSSHRITVRTPIRVEIDYWQLVADVPLEIWVDVFNATGTHVFQTGCFGQPPSPAGLFRSSFVIPGDLLNNGRHWLTISVCTGKMPEPLYLGHDLVFDVDDAEDLRASNHFAWEGVIRPHLKWETQQLEDERVLTRASTA